MKQCAYIVLKPREDRRLRLGHPWVFDNEIASITGGGSSSAGGGYSADHPASGNLAAGSRVQIFSAAKEFLGSGLYSPVSKIKVRRYSLKDDEFDADLLRQLLEAAIALRRRHYSFEKDSCRLVFGEADGLPGLVVDRFVGSDPSGRKGSWLSLQLSFAGLQPYRQPLLDTLQSLLQPDGIVERSEAQVMELEGLATASGVISGMVPESIIIEENGLRFKVELATGQKTGWFLDQRDNRAACARYARGARVLDVCSNAGGFSLCAAAAGAESVLAVDVSESALAGVQANAALNKLDNRVQTTQADAFEFLRGARQQTDRYDLIIVDPPAFAKSRAALNGALRGYKDINLQALKVLKPGGILASFSCSYWLSRELLKQQLEAAAADAGLRLRYLEERQQALDHPMVSGYPESAYLKGFIVQARAW